MPLSQLLLISALNPEAGSVRGTSLLRGLPFVSETLLKIYKTLGVNWDRLGNVRFAVTCKPDPSGLYAGSAPSRWPRSGAGPCGLGK